jgi:hypothetical protein
VGGSPFSYAILRVVPRVERGERLNVGVVVFCRPLGYLGAKTGLDAQRLRVLAPDLDPALVLPHLAAVERIAAGDADAGPIEVIRPGDRVFFEPGEDHWHGAAPNRFMTHVAIQEADETGSPVTWAEHVTDEEYGAEPADEA